MNFSNDGWQLSDEFRLCIALTAGERLTVMADVLGYIVVKRTELCDFENMMLMGAEISQ